MKLIKNGRKLLIAGVALAACIGFTLNANAQNCTVDNWEGATSGLTDANTGTQGANNRRYYGPCALRVNLDGTERYVADDKPAGTETYIVRFYTFLDNAGSNPVQIYGADGDGDDQIQVWYNDPNAGDLTLRVYDAGRDDTDISFNAVGSGWHSVEFVWAAEAAANILFSVDGAADLSASVNTAGLYIDNAYLGNISGVNGGSLDFDDYDSRRDTRPGRQLVGDANGDGSLDAFDGLELRDELSELGFAAGQADCNEDGEVDAFDALCLRNLLM